MDIFPQERQTVLMRYKAQLHESSGGTNRQGRRPRVIAKLTRRIVVGGLSAAPLAMPGLIRAQSSSKPVRIGLLSDMGGPYRDVGGPGNKVATDLAIADFGGSVLGRPI